MRRRTCILGVSLILAIVVGCGHNDPNVSATSNESVNRANKSVELVAPESIKPVWQALTGSDEPLALTVIGEYVVATGDGVRVFDVRTGRIRWRRPSGNVSAASLPLLYVSDQHGGVDALNLADGESRWHAAHLCPAADGAYSVSLISATIIDVFAGCTSGTLFRLDAHTGRKLAVWNFDSVARFYEIRLLSRNTVAVTLVTDGALLVSHLVLLRRNDLDQLATDWQEATILGVVGATAVIDDGCCYGRRDLPVSLFHYDLHNGSVSQPYNVPRDSDALLGLGSTAAILGAHLYVSSAPTIDDEGYPLAPSRRPRRLVSDLIEPAMFVVGERAMVRVHANDGEKYELLDLQTAPPRLLWSGRPGVVSYDKRSSPDTIVLLDSGPEHRKNVFLRVADGRVIAPRDPCGYIATAPRLIIAQCMVHSKNFDTIEAFDVDSSDARRTMHDARYADFKVMAFLRIPSAQSLLSG